MIEPLPDSNSTLNSDGQIFLAETLADALQAIRLYLGMDVAFITEFVHDQCITRHVDLGPGAPRIHAGDAIPLDQSICQRVVNGQLPEALEDIATHPGAADLRLVHAFSIRSYIGVPIRLSNGAIFGAVGCLATRSTKKFDELHLTAIRLFAGVIGGFIERHSKQVRYDLEKRARVDEMIRERRFSTVYQPIINVQDHKAVGYEALTRFATEPARTPDQWFRDAREVGLSPELETAAIEKALENFHRFPRDSYLSLNISPETLLYRPAIRCLSRLPLERIALEITEHAYIADYLRIHRVLRPLRKRGLRLSIDDAGAGHSTFRHILILKPDIIKLDRSLIHNLNSKQERRALCAALIRFSEETGSRVIAEGVETEAELETLRQLNVAKVQGYLTGRPAPADVLFPTEEEAPLS